MTLLVVVAICLLAWPLLTIGLTYLVREAQALAAPRGLLLRWRPGLVDLIACGECTSLWTGTAAYAIVLPIGVAALGAAWSAWWWLWPLAPLAGICGTGLFNRMTRTGALGAVYKLAELLRRAQEQP